MSLQLLHIDASARPGSYSRQMSQAFVDRFVSLLPDTTVIRTDLNAAPPPFVDENFLANAFLPEAQQDSKALAASNQYTRDFLSADVVVVGMPMYNWGVPAIVKAWIDQIVRSGLTFSMSANGIEGLAQPDKEVFSLVSRNGGFLPGEPFANANFQDGHFAGIMGFLGVKQTRLEALQDIFNPATLEQNLATALGNARKLAEETAARHKKGSRAGSDLWNRAA